MKVRGKEISEYGGHVQETYQSWMNDTDNFAKRIIENYEVAISYINSLSDDDFNALILGQETNLLPYLDPGFYSDPSGLNYLKSTLEGNKQYLKETAEHEAEMAEMREEYGDQVGRALTEKEKVERARVQAAYNDQKAIQDRMETECYIEDFGDELNVGDGNPHASAPQWVHDGWQALIDYWGYPDFNSIAQNIRNRLPGQSDRDVAFDSVPYGMMRNVSTALSSHEGVVSVEYISDEDEAKRTIAWRREQIRLFRSGEITQINWRPPDTSDTIIAAVQQIKARGQRSEFTKSGKPTVRATSKESKQRVSAKQRDAAWEQIQ